ncbi:MAG: LysR family transcriptional regulator [Planctomycetes bacterium]|nr:LysR family transcriptional regulator [Planctomycetota bacterium]MCB9910277.1 LysR family transcriptional regulator [Planctomycetota bacterium]HPF14584.1 LysR substrate-binding domain-containing protein [Planctomycetota bacterium]
MRDASHIELRHLRTFLVVAETENFTRAAERLSITQPSVSIQVKELEAAVGAQLFSRLGPRVALTPAGRSFRERAALVLQKLNDACQAVQDTEDLAAGHLSMVVIPPLNVPWIPPVLGRIAREHPGMAITLFEESADDLEIHVENGRCDLGVGILSHASPNLQYEVLRTDELVLLTPPDGAFAHKRSVTAAQVGEERLVVLPESYVLRQESNAAFRRARVIPKIALEVDTVEALLATVAEGGLCTLMPKVVLEGRHNLNLRAVPLDGWGCQFEFGIIRPANEVDSAPAKVFSDYLREAVGAQPQSKTKPKPKAKPSAARRPGKQPKQG